MLFFVFFRIFLLLDLLIGMNDIDIKIILEVFLGWKVVFVNRFFFIELEILEIFCLLDVFLKFMDYRSSYFEFLLYS